MSFLFSFVVCLFKIWMAIVIWWLVQLKGKEQLEKHKIKIFENWNKLHEIPYNHVVNCRFWMNWTLCSHVLLICVTLGNANRNTVEKVHEEGTPFWKFISYPYITLTRLTALMIDMKPLVHEQLSCCTQKCCSQFWLLNETLLPPISSIISSIISCLTCHVNHNRILYKLIDLS